MAYVYILESIEGKYYIGSTINIEKRIKHHFGLYTPSTKRLKVSKLKFSQKYPTLKEARYVEKRLKELKRKDYIDKIIKDGHIKIKLG